MNMRDIERFYADRIEKATRWRDGLADITARGLNPAFVLRLIEQGPDQALPLLEQIATDEELFRAINGSAR